MEEQKINTLVNLGQGKVVEKVYDDLISPVTQKVGQALSTIVDVGNTILLPVKLLNSKAKLFFDNNLKKYQEKIEQIPDEKIITVPTEICIPILERFGHITNQELSDAFVKLLVNASNFDTASLAHPGFISIIDRLCPDEAKLLKHFKTLPYIPCVHLKAHKADGSSHYRKYSERTGLEKVVDLDFAQNINIYLDCIASLGLINKKGYSKVDDSRYQNVISLYPNDIEEFKIKLSSEFFEPIWTKEIYEITDYGRLFISAVIE